MLLQNLPAHHEVKLEGRKGVCICCSMAEGIHQDVPPKLYMAATTVVFTCAEVAAFFSITRKTHPYNLSGINTFAIYVI